MLFDVRLGWQNKERKVPLTENTIFRLASLTKPITSAAVLTLVDQGKIELEDMVSKYLPEFSSLTVYGNREEHEITVAQLLSHTSGMSGGFEQGPVGELYRRHYQKSFSDLASYAVSYASLPLQQPPGTGFIYSHGPDVLAYLVEKVSGLS